MTITLYPCVSMFTNLTAPAPDFHFGETSLFFVVVVELFHIT